MDLPSSRSSPPQDQQFISSSCSPYISVQVRESKHEYRDCDSSSSITLDGHCSGVGKEQKCCSECMEGRHHDGAGVAHNPPLDLRNPTSNVSPVSPRQLDPAKVGRKAHGKGSYRTGTSSVDGPRLADWHTHNGRPYDLGAGFVSNQRAGDDGKCPESGPIQGLRRGRRQSCEFGTRRRTVRNSQSDGTSRIFDDSDKEDRDPQRRAIRDSRTSSSQ